MEFHINIITNIQKFFIQDFKNIVVTNQNWTGHFGKKLNDLTWVQLKDILQRNVALPPPPAVGGRHSASLAGDALRTQEYVRAVANIVVKENAAAFTNLIPQVFDVAGQIADYEVANPAAPPPADFGMQGQVVNQDVAIQLDMEDEQGEHNPANN